jgi:large repetitive protein
VRINASGTVLDVPAIRLPVKKPYYYVDPAVATNGRDFLVVWGDGRNGVDDDVYGAYVSAATGAVSPGNGFPVATQALNQLSPELAYDRVSRNFLVAWHHADFTPSTSQVRGGRVNGITALDPAGFDLSGTSGHDFGPQVAAGDQEFLVVWNDGRNVTAPFPNTGFDIYGSFVSPGGVVLTPGAFQVSNNAENEFTPDVAYGGNGEFSVVWEDRRNGGFGAEDIYTTCIASTGGGSYTILSPNGSPLVRSPGQQRWVSSTFSNGRFRHAWGDDRNAPGDHDIRGIWSQHCDPASPFKVSGTVPGIQAFTAIASDPSGTSLIVWEDGRPAAAPGHDIYGALVSPNGTVLVPNILIAH